MQLACLSAIGSLDVPPNLGTSHAKTKIAIDSVECVNTHTPHTHTRTTHYTHLFTSTGVREATEYNVTLFHHFSHTVTALGTSIHNWFTLQVDRGRRVLLTKTCRGSYLHGQADIKFSLGKTQLTNTQLQDVSNQRSFKQGFRAVLIPDNVRTCFVAHQPAKTSGQTSEKKGTLFDRLFLYALEFKINVQISSKVTCQHT